MHNTHPQPGLAGLHPTFAPFVAPFAPARPPRLEQRQPLTPEQEEQARLEADLYLMLHKDELRNRRNDDRALDLQIRHQAWG